MKKLIWLIVVALIAGGAYIVKKKKEELANLPTPTPPKIVVETAKPKEMEINQTLTLLGTYYSFEAAQVASKSAGRIEKIHVHEGERVQKGQRLVEMEASDIEAQLVATKKQIEALSKQIEAQKASLEAARIDERNAYKSLARDRKLYKAGALAKELLEQKEARYAAAKAKRVGAEAALRGKLGELAAAKKSLEAKEQLLGYAKLTAPIDGVVAKIFFKQGSFAPMGKPIMTILGDRWVIDAPFEEGVEPQMAAIVAKKRCEVQKILPVAANGLRLARIECGERLPYPDKSQLRVDVVQKSILGPALPIKALYEKGDERYVLVKKDGEFVPVKVRVVATDGRYFIPEPAVSGEVAVGSNEKLGKLFLRRQGG
jgi:biotin carboxyl carrier protein